MRKQENPAFTVHTLYCFCVLSIYRICRVTPRRLPFEMLFILFAPIEKKRERVRETLHV